MCAALGEHVFTCTDKESANKCKTTKNKLVECLRTTHSQDMATEVDTRTDFILKEPEYMHSVATVQLKPTK